MNKVFFFDLDGTLLQHGTGNRISEKDVYALNELTRQGHDVVLNTGKSYEMCIEQFKYFDFKYTITSNGQVLTDNKETIFAGAFDREKIDFWVEYAKNNNLAIGFQTTSGQYILNINDAKYYANLCFGNLNVNLPSICDEVPYDKMVQQIWLLGDIDNLKLVEDYDYFKWHTNGLDVQIGGINKGSGIKRFLKYKSYSDYKLYTFGDGMNDLAMFEIADVSVAMDNAIDEVKNKVDYVTSSVELAGVYNFLVEHELIQEMI